MPAEFAINIYDATHARRIDGVTSFVGEDRSGSFGILPHHARFMTLLVFGLARFRTGEGTWHYLAVPGGVLYFSRNELTVSCRHFLIDRDYAKISSALARQLLAEEEKLHAIKESLHRMEQAMLNQLWEKTHKSSL